MESIIPAAVLTVSTLVNNALTSAKTAREVAKQSQDSALKDQISDLYDAIIDIKARVLEIDEENRSLRQRLAQKESIKRESICGFWFKEEEKDPLCPRCYEGPEQRVVYLAPKVLDQYLGYQRFCNVCRSTYQGEADRNF